MIGACLLFGLVLLGASLGLSGDPEGDRPLDRLQDVARGGLAAPEPGDTGDGGAVVGDAPPAAADPPPLPPASAPPDDGPSQSQYAGDG